MAVGEWIESYVPARLDRMPWSRWHWLIVVSLGVTWILDGLEVTLAGSLGGILTRSETLGLSDAQVGASATCYLSGAVLGALLFGYGTDRLGRKKLFFITVAVYLIATGLTAFSWSFASYAFFRALTGAGIGGEYAAINSAIDELIPARVRGRVDLIINGSYWVGAALGSGATIFLLDPNRFPIWLGWRFAFGIGAMLGLIVIFFRRWIPESPRWLMIHGREIEAEKIVDLVEANISSEQLLPHDTPPTRIRTRTHTPWREIWHAIAHEHRRRSFLGFVLMLTQAFFYNAIFFTYALVLMRFYNVPAGNVGGNLWRCRNLISSQRLAFSRRPVDRANADARLDTNFLRRFGGSELGIPDGQRNLSARNSRARYRNFLCDRNAGRRRGRADFVRLDHRHRIERRVVRRLSRRRRAYDYWSVDGALARRCGGTAVTRAYRRAVIESLGANNQFRRVN
jgi:MFS family permease